MRGLGVGGWQPTAVVPVWRSRMARAVLLCLCVSGMMCAGLWWGGGVASAESGHAFASSLSQAPAGAGLVAPDAVAVDQVTGEVFVGDGQAGYVDVFSANGTYETRFGEGWIDAVSVAVDESSGAVYVVEPLQNAVLVYEPDGGSGFRLVGRWTGRGLPEREFGAVAGVAVDNGGGPAARRVYVVESQIVGSETGAVEVFEPKPNPVEGQGEEGVLLGRFAGPVLQDPNAVAVSAATGRVLVADSVVGVIYAYSTAGAYEGKLSGKGSPNGSFKANEETGNVVALGINETSGDVYVAEAERHVVSQYSSSGQWEGWITTTPAGDLLDPLGVALTATGEVYVADAGRGLVDRFASAKAVPGVETGKVAKSGLTRTSAVLSGSIDGEGEIGEYWFQYGETPALGSQTTQQAVGTGSQSVSARLEGLEAGHLYFYRLVGEDANGTSYGAIRELETSAAVDGVASGPSLSVSAEDAMLTGSLKREGLQTHYYFQYGTSSSYGKQAPEPAGEVPAAKEEKEEKQPKTVEAAIESLMPNTVYHYRLVAQNSYGTTYGEEETFTTQGPPQVGSEPPSGVSQTGETLHAQIDPDGLETHYRFQYGPTTAYGQETLLEGAGSGSTAQAVSAVLEGLNVGASYHYRVIAENAAGITAGTDETFTTIPSAPVDATFTTQVRANSATLHTLIDPLGNDTRYYFQYGTEPCTNAPGTCASSPAAPGEDIGAGSEDVPGEVTITGLTPGTTYHYRVLDTNVLGTTEGPEHQFTTKTEETPVALLDGRAWEMVSPPQKGGAPLEAQTREGGVIRASEDGNALTYLADNALGEEAQGNRSPEWQQILATRNPSGWSSQDIATPSSKAEGATPGMAPEYQFFDRNLSTDLVEPVGHGPEPPLAPGVNQATIYLRDNATGTYLPLVIEANTAPGTQFGGKISFVSASPNLEHVVIASSVALTGAGSAPGLYEWSGGALQLVSVLPSGAPPSGGKPELGFYHVTAHAISEDGSRIIWTKKEESTAAGRLYLRDTVRGQTLRLDAAQGIAEPGKASAQFQWANSDGTEILFTDKQRLTPDSTAEPVEPPSADLYECVIIEERGRLTCRLKDLTVDRNPREHATVRYFIFGAGEDGSSIYLVASGVLASNRNGKGETAQAGQNNLYELHYDGTTWSRTFIATLSSEDGPEWAGGSTGNTSFLTASVSPNGRYLAFMSSAPITGYDNVDANTEAKGARDEEVFLYDSATESLRCVSCNPSGARPNGVLDHEEAGEGLGLLVDRRGLWLGRRLAGNVPGWTAQDLVSALFQPRYLSDEGRLYFNSPDDLVPAATNGKEDVYEYEPAGVGSCESATGGCVSLISGGSSDHESAFLEATPDGSNVFFLTAAQLVPQDTDTAFDIYDARECTALSPCLTPPATEGVPCTETEACRPAAPAQVIPVPSGTVDYSGPGNVLSQPPPVGKRQIQGRKVSKAPTLAQQLKLALEHCRKAHVHSQRKRKICERDARKRYAGKRKPNRANRSARRSGR